MLRGTPSALTGSATPSLSAHRHYAGTLVDVELEPARTLQAGPLDLSCLGRSERSLLKKEWSLKRSTRDYSTHASWCRIATSWEPAGEALTIAEMAAQAMTECCLAVHLPPARLLRELTAVLSLASRRVISPSASSTLLLGTNLEFLPSLQPLSVQVRNQVLAAVEAGCTWASTPAAHDAVDVYVTFTSVPAFSSDAALTKALGFESDLSCPTPLDQLLAAPSPSTGPDRRLDFMHAHACRPRSPGLVLVRSRLKNYSLAAKLVPNSLLADALAATAHPSSPAALALPSSWSSLLDGLSDSDRAQVELDVTAPGDSDAVVETALQVFPSLPPKDALIAARALEA